MIIEYAKVSPKISVVMPVYHSNPEKLTRAINSILNQTFREFEFIIVVDELTEDEREILKETAQFHTGVRVYISSIRHGLVNALNKGFAVAQGKYIVRMDCDDFSYSDRLQKQFDFMEFHPEVGVAGCCHYLNREGKTVICRYPKDHATIQCALIFDTAFSHPCIIMRRDFIQTISGPYDSDFIYAEDYELWVRVMDKTTLANMDDILLFVENDGSNVCDSNHDELIKQTIRIREIAACKFGFPLQQLQSDEGRMKWLEQIYATNKIRRVFPRGYLNARLGRDWYNFCLKETKYGLVAWRTFWHSPLHECIYLNPLRRLKFLVACLIKWELK